MAVALIYVIDRIQCYFITIIIIVRVIISVLSLSYYVYPCIFMHKYTLTIMHTTILFSTVFGIGSAQLINTNDCTCPNDIVTYNCYVTESGFTIWRGSAFDCPTVDSRILLRHSSFGTHIGTMGLCNDGAIIGHSLGVDTNSLDNVIYISQLMINLTAAPSVVGQTVDCVYRTPSGIDTLVGSTVITITGMYIALPIITSSI